MLVLFILTRGTVLGASKTWNGGGGDNNWNTGANWGGSAPVANDILFFGGSTRLGPTNNITADTNFAGITFNSGAGAFTLSGNRITLGGNVTNSTNLQTINLAMILSANRTFTTLTGGGNLTIGGVLSETGGARGIIKAGAGTLTLSGVNTYTGATTVSAGILKAGVASVANTSGAFGNNSAVTLANTAGVTLDITGFNTQIGSLTGGGATGGNVTLGAATLTTGGDNTSPAAYAGVISGTGGLTKIGTGTQTLSGINTYTGGTTLTLGTLQLSGSGTLGSTSGTLTVNGGTLDLNGTSQGVGNFTGSGGTILNNSTGTNVTLTIGNGNGTGGNYSGVIADHTSGTGTVALTKTGSGTITLSGTNTYSGGTAFNAGTISISSDANLGASSGGLTFNGGTLQSTNDVVGSRAIIMTGAGAFSGAFGKTLEESGAVSGNGNLTVAGSGTLILSGSGSNGTGTTTVSGAVLSLRGTVSLGSGVLTLSGGLLELGNGNFTRALGAGAGQVNMSGAGGSGFAAFGADRTVNLGGSGATVTWGAGNFVASGQTLYLGTPTADSMVDFQNPINLNLASRTITVTNGVGTGIDAKLSGVISGTGASNFVMSAVGFAPWNPGSLLLSNGNNSYAGTTTISAGTLLLGANATGTAGNTVLGSGATDVLVGNTTGALNAGLLTNGAFTISRNIRAQSGNTGTISIGGYTADASTFSGNVFLGTNSVATGKSVTFTAASNGTVTFSGIIQNPTGVTTPGSVTKSGAGIVIFSGANTYTGSTTVNDGTLRLGLNNAVPTASTVVVSSGGTLDNGGFTLAGNGIATLSVQNGGTLRLGGSTGFPTNYGSVTLGTSSTVEYAAQPADSCASELRKSHREQCERRNTCRTCRSGHH